LKKGTSFDQALIWELFEKTLKAAQILDETGSEISEIQTVQSKLWGPKIGIYLFYFLLFCFCLCVGLGGEFLEWFEIKKIYELF
jgi:hypothetical protein